MKSLVKSGTSRHQAHQKYRGMKLPCGYPLKIKERRWEKSGKSLNLPHQRFRPIGQLKFSSPQSMIFFRTQLPGMLWKKVFPHNCLVHQGWFNLYYIYDMDGSIYTVYIYDIMIISQCSICRMFKWITRVKIMWDVQDAPGSLAYLGE